LDLIPPAYYANVATLSHDDSFIRLKPREKHYPLDQLYQVDSVFAVIMMKPIAYNIDYKWHIGGEDYGWSLNLRDSGIESWFDSRILCQHLYNKPGV
jgi:hypothetical protein